jgi:HSP90 family molecular chaperone
VVGGSVDTDAEERVRLRTSECITLEAAMAKLVTHVYLLPTKEDLAGEKMAKVKEIVEAHSGEVPVRLELEVEGKKVLMEAGVQMRIRPSFVAIGKLREVLGPDRVKLAVQAIEVQKPKWQTRRAQAAGV